MVMKKKLWKRYQKIFKRTSKPPVTNKDNSEDIKKVVKLSWIPIIEPKRQALKKTLKPLLCLAQI